MMLQWNKNMKAIDESFPKFESYLIDDENVPVTDQELSSDAPEEAIEAFKVFKENAEILRSMMVA